MSEALVETIKQIAVKAVQSEKMSSLVIGTVNSTSPLSVYIENVGTVPAAMLRTIEPIKSTGVVNTGFTTTVSSTGTSSTTGSATGTITVDVKDSSDVKIGTASGSVTLPVTGSGTASVSGTASAGGNKTVESTATGLRLGAEVALLRYTGGNRFLILGAIGGV